MLSKKGFSLIELLISLMVISCIMAAMAPVISRRMTTNDIIVSQKSSETSSQQEDSAQENIEKFFELIKDCKLDQDRTKLLCEFNITQDMNSELSELAELNKNESVNNNDKSINKVVYSDRRDKIRFKDRESGNYQTTTIVQKEYANETDNLVKNVKKYSIPIDEDTLMLDKIEEIKQIQSNY